MKRVYPSGFSKMMEKKRKADAAIDNTTKIHSFFSMNSQSLDKDEGNNSNHRLTSLGACSSNDSSYPHQVTQVTQECADVLNQAADIDESAEASCRPQSDTTSHHQLDVQQDLSNPIDFNLEIDHPSDRGNFKINLSSDLKTILAKHGSCQPKGPVVVNGKKFHVEFYYRR